MIYVEKQSLSIFLSKYVFQCVLVTLLMSKPTISKLTTFAKSQGLANLQKKLEKHALHEVNKDVGKIQEIIKANLQRSKVIQVKTSQN